MTLTKEHFKNKQEIKWCPGCGDYAILSTIQKTLPLLNIPKEKFVFISGIGCSGRLPYYLDVFGFHTLHGRAPTVATGLKLTRPDLSVWLVIGDGDGFSIGSNHLLHLLRRNVDINILFINNKTYGLTKGQYSPTSDLGTHSPTSPNGTVDSPVNPLAFALTAGATFIARGIDTDSERLQKIFIEAAIHKGSSFIEIYQNCYIFNNNASSVLRDKKQQANHCLHLAPNEPMLFGDNNQKAFKGSHGAWEIIDRSSEPANHFLIHNPENDLHAYQLCTLSPDRYPIPFGIIKKIAKPIFGYAQAKYDVKQLCKQFIEKKLPPIQLKG